MGYLEHLKRPIIIKTNIIIWGHAIWSIPILPLFPATNGIFLFAYQSPSSMSNFRSINDFDWPAQFTHFCHHIAICIMSRIFGTQIGTKSIRIHRVRTLSPYTRVPMCRAERKDTPLWMKRKLRSHGRRWSVRHTYGILPKKSVTLNNCYGFNRYFQKFPKCVSLHFTLVVK